MVAATVSIDPDAARSVALDEQQKELSLAGEQADLFGGSQEKFKPTVSDGTPLNEAVSSLIKEMRRGKELEALYWATLIEENFWKYLWRRLAIFAAEDVGFGNPMAIVIIESLASAYERIKRESRKDKPDGNLVSFAVLTLCRSEKNREADHLKNVLHVVRRRYGWMAKVPEYAVDAHTERGRKIWTDKHDRDRMWFLEWSSVKPEVGPLDWQLWHLRRIAHEGVIDPAWVEEKAKEWEKEGLLFYGLEGPENSPYTAAEAAKDG